VFAERAALWGDGRGKMEDGRWKMEAKNKGRM